jgi:1-acyl-sn-glycerol-3-phosphate acyltransferase
LFPPLPGVKLQPVAIDYGDAGEEIAWIGNEAAAANAKRVLSRPGTARVTVTFLEPIDPAALRDRKALAELSRDAIVRALGASA